MRKRSFEAASSQGNRAVRKFATHRGGIAAAALSGCLAFSGAWGAEQPRENTFEITPFFGQMFGGAFEDPTDNSERDVKSDTNFGIFLNLIADIPERQYELFYTKQGTVIEGTVPIDVDIDYLQLGGTVAYPQAKHVIPYFGATFGGTRFAPDEPGLDDETKLSFSVGGGMKFPITDHFGVRFDLRGFITLLDTDSDIFCVSDPANTSGCLIKAKSDTFIQYAASLGFSMAF